MSELHRAIQLHNALHNARGPVGAGSKRTGSSSSTVSGDVQVETFRAQAVSGALPIEAGYTSRECFI